MFIKTDLDLQARMVIIIDLIDIYENDLKSCQFFNI